MASSSSGKLRLSTSESAMNEQPQELGAGDPPSSDPVNTGTHAEPMEAEISIIPTDTAGAVAAAAAAMETEPTPGASTAAASTEDRPCELPFQVQITYTDLDGAEAVRVLTQTQPVTRDRQQAETCQFLLCVYVERLITVPG